MNIISCDISCLPRWKIMHYLTIFSIYEEEREIKWGTDTSIKFYIKTVERRKYGESLTAKFQMCFTLIGFKTLTFRQNQHRSIIL